MGSIEDIKRIRGLKYLNYLIKGLNIDFKTEDEVKEEFLEFFKDDLTPNEYGIIKFNFDYFIPLALTLDKEIEEVEEDDYKDLKEEWHFKNNNDFIDKLRLNEEKELFWNKEEQPFELIPSIEDIIMDHEKDYELISKYNKFVHIVAWTEDMFEFLKNENQFGKSLTWCRCLLVTENRKFAHEHWHILFRFNYNYKYKVWYNSKSITQAFRKLPKPEGILQLFKTLTVCECSSSLNGIIHYIGCATGQRNKHLHLDRHSSWLHLRQTLDEPEPISNIVYSECQKIMFKIEETYGLKYHNHRNNDEDCICVIELRQKLERDQLIRSTRREYGCLYKNKERKHPEEGPDPDPKVISYIIKLRLQQLKNTI